MNTEMTAAGAASPLTGGTHTLQASRDDFRQSDHAVGVALTRIRGQDDATKSATLVTLKTLRPYEPHLTGSTQEGLVVVVAARRGVSDPACPVHDVSRLVEEKFDHILRTRPQNFYGNSEALEDSADQTPPLRPVVSGWRSRDYCDMRVGQLWQVGDSAPPHRCQSVC